MSKLKEVEVDNFLRSKRTVKLNGSTKTIKEFLKQQVEMSI